jgi:hypothetical protein
MVAPEQCHMNTEAFSLANQLEAIVDARSLQSVIAALVTICHEKADHVETNWQDAKLAQKWRAAARHLDRIDPIASQIP